MATENHISIALSPTEPAGPNSHRAVTNAQWLIAEAKANHAKGRHCLIIETGGQWQLVRNPIPGTPTIYSPGHSAGANR
jgi:hypothetical protein